MGAQLLTHVLTLPPNVKERHDTLEFVNHIYIHHKVRLVVSVDRLPTSTRSAHRQQLPYRAWGQRSLQTESGRIVVPLGDLDRHSRATTHITDEAGDIVPLFTASELNSQLGSGLVCYAAQILGEVPPELAQHLRAIPAKAAAHPQPAGKHSQEAADQAFDDACDHLLRQFGVDGMKLLETLAFRVALAVVTGSVQLVVDVDPRVGSMRVFSYSYFRPIRQRASKAKEGGPRRWWRRWARCGVTDLTIDLGPMGGCERYQLSADAPFDTWFSNARMERRDAAEPEPALVDTSQEFRLSYTQTAPQSPWSGSLRVQLRAVYTGVSRASVYGSAFLAFCAVVGLIRVCLADDHTLIPEETDAAVALLLLFPGIAASAVAGVAKNTLTATIQFPIRLALWGMSLASFVLATAAAFRLSGTWSIVLWGLITFAMCFAALFLRWRSREWRQGANSLRAHVWEKSDALAVGEAELALATVSDEHHGTPESAEAAENP